MIAASLPSNRPERFQSKIQAPCLHVFRDETVERTLMQRTMGHLRRTSPSFWDERLLRRLICLDLREHLVSKLCFERIDDAIILQVPKQLLSQLFRWDLVSPIRFLVLRRLERSALHARCGLADSHKPWSIVRQTFAGFYLATHLEILAFSEPGFCLLRIHPLRGRLVLTRSQP